MRHAWDPEDLVAAWTLVEADWQLVANKTGATRLGFALLLKFFELEAHFPSAAGEVPPVVVEYVARQVQVPADQFGAYSWSGRSVKYHRAQIREAFGFREPTRDDETMLIAWLTAEVCPVEFNDERVCEALRARCRSNQIEPPGRVERIIGAAQAAFEEQFCARTVARLSAATAACLEALVVDPDQVPLESDPVGILAQLKADPGPLGL